MTEPNTHEEKQAKMFLAVTCASRNTTVQVFSIVSLSRHEGDAAADCYRQLYEKFPPSEGWLLDTPTCREIDPSLIRKAVASLPDPRDAELSALTHALGLSHARVAELEADSADKLKLVTEWRECLDKRTAEKDALREELSALRKQLESSQGTISEYRRVVHRNSDDLREMVEEVRAAKRECDAAQTAARQAGRQDAATYILTHPYCREVDRMQDLCDCRPMAEDIIAGEKLPPLSSLPASAPAETRDPLAVFHDGSLIILITGLPQHYHTPAVLDWYAKTYAIERRKLGASPIQTVKYDAPAETPEALCVCGHPKSKHRPNGVCYHQCGPYLTCNCGKFEAFAPPVAPSAPATTGEALNCPCPSGCYKTPHCVGSCQEKGGA